jgi:hypothetical protein
VPGCGIWFRYSIFEISGKRHLFYGNIMSLDNKWIKKNSCAILRH